MKLLLKNLTTELTNTYFLFQNQLKLKNMNTKKKQKVREKEVLLLQSHIQF